MEALPVDAIMAVSSVCRRYHSLARHRDVWRRKWLDQGWQHRQQSTSAVDDWYDLYKQRYQLEQRWLRGQASTHYLLGHQDSVYCLQFDDTKIVTGSRDKTIKFWNIHTLECTATLYGHEGSVLALQFNDSWMVSGSSDTSIIVWDLRTQKPVRRLLVINVDEACALHVGLTD